MSEEVRDGLKEVDGIEVTTLMDNYVDVLLRNSTGVRRPPMAIGGEIQQTRCWQSTVCRF